MVPSASSPEQGVCRWKMRNSPDLYSPEGISERPVSLRVSQMLRELFAGPIGGKKGGRFYNIKFRKKKSRSSEGFYGGWRDFPSPA